MVPATWTASERDADYLVQRLVPAPFGTGNPNVRRQRERGICGLLHWLNAHPGISWQQRWMASEAEDQPGALWRSGAAAWLTAQGLPTSEAHLATGLLALICGDVVRPSLRWMLTRVSPKFVAAMERSRDPEGIAALRVLAKANPTASPLIARLALTRVCMIMAAKGGLVRDITVGDCVELLDIQSEVHAKGGTCKTYFYQLLRDSGILPPQAPATVRAFRSASGQHSIEDLVDRFGVTHPGLRDLFVDYLRERRPALDYTTLVDLAHKLIGLFWCDLEAHHPGIATLHLAPEVAHAWKQRVAVKSTSTAVTGARAATDQVARLNAKGCLLTVRSFYRDIAHRALEDPARWGPWVAPCPITDADVDRRKDRRARKSRMDQRTRERLPLLPTLARSIDQQRKDAAQRLEAARATAPGERFTVGDHTLIRPIMPTAGGTKIWADDPHTGARRDLTHEEHLAFWAWATVEVLRHTGIRIEELLELTHHSFVQYRLPSTGEIVPLLQIAPSKTDAERLLLISPELADVLSTIIRRVRKPTGAVPLVPSYDPHECLWRPPAPLLFQRRFGAEDRALSRRTVETALAHALATADVTSPDGKLLRFTPHDFRRIFVTDAVMQGLPPHIAQIICGHRDINTTMGYKAIYPEEAITAHQAFIARRRSMRPSHEYRTPTQDEWNEFLAHFEKRKVSIGLCGRAFGTPCIHEHACIRCSMLWPDPTQQHRLTEIRDNLQDRIAEAEREGWLGEIEGLKVSLAAANAKLAQLTSTSADPPKTDLGMPLFPSQRRPSQPS